VKIELGRRAYLWISAPETFSDSCVISSHGGESQGCYGNSFSTPNWCTLRFYSDHGHVVVDKGLDKFMGLDLNARVRVLSGDDGERKRVYAGGDQCPDYKLTKFQASDKVGATNVGRSKSETYAHVETLVRALDQLEDTMSNLLAMSELFKQGGRKKSIEKQPLIGEDSSSDSRASVPAQYDIVTVRNRGIATDLYLSEVLAALRSVHRYKTVHCYFCRGNARG